MNSSSDECVGASVLVRFIVALAAAVFSVSCAGPSSRTDRVAAATEALDAVGDPVLSPEFDLDHSAVVEQATTCPQVAFGTTGYLLVEEYGSGQLAATRFDRNGNKSQSFDIPGAFPNMCAPVVFAGGAFIALWAAQDGILWCTRFAEDGSLLNGGGASTGLSSIGVDSATLDSATLDGNGTKILVSTTDGKVALVGADCSAIAAPISLPATAGATRWPSGAAFDGTQYWVA